MPIAFPLNPTIGQEYTFNGRTFVWQGTGWQRAQVNALTSDLLLQGAGRRIRGDLSGTPLSGRLMQQTSETNGPSYSGVIPHGTGQASGWSAFNRSTPDAAAYTSLQIDNSVARWVIGKTGGASQEVPGAINMSGQDKIVFGTDNTMLNRFAQRHFETVLGTNNLQLDCKSGNCFYGDVSGNVTQSFQNAPTDGDYTAKLTIAHLGGVITWDPLIDWSNQAAPALTTSRTHLFLFTRRAAGRWRGTYVPNFTYSG